MGFFFPRTKDQKISVGPFFFLFIFGSLKLDPIGLSGRANFYCRGFKIIFFLQKYYICNFFFSGQGVRTAWLQRSAASNWPRLVSLWFLGPCSALYCGGGYRELSITGGVKFVILGLAVNGCVLTPVQARPLYTCVLQCLCNCVSGLCVWKP